MNEIWYHSFQHNIGVLVVGFIFAFIGVGLDALFGFHSLANDIFRIVGVLLLAIGFGIRVWATYYFYKAHLKVIKLAPQTHLITKGPFKYSRNPLYLGGNVFIFLGACMFLGTIMGVVLTILQLIPVNMMIKHEEKQLHKKFGQEWTAYTKKTRRWI